MEPKIQENLNPPRFDLRVWPQSREQAHRNGAYVAQCGFRFKAGSLDQEYPGETEAERENRIAYRAGYQAELARIANRKMTAERREFLIAHDRAVAAFKAAVDLADKNRGWAGRREDAHRDVAFVRADLLLFGLSPWVTLGITLAQYQGPAAQAKGRLYDPALIARA